MERKNAKMTDDFDRDDDVYSEEDMDEQDARVAAILGEPFAEVGETTLIKYQDYLERQLTMPCRLTGIEDFAWEERYVFGLGSKRKYEKLKKKWPSYTDEFEFLDFDDHWDNAEGLFVKVRRVSDEKAFAMPLADLKAIDESSGNYQLLDDYSVWFVNSR